MADPAQSRDIRATLGRLAEPDLEMREADIGSASHEADHSADVIMFVFGPDQQRAGVTGAVAARGGEGTVRIALMQDRSTQAIREALRAGADEVLFLPLDDGDLARALIKINESRRLREPAISGKLISLISVTGGAGVTTLAANCALALAHSAGKKVALADLDFQSGDLTVALNVEPEHGILDLNEPGVRLNSVQVESALTRHSSGVYLLAAPKRIEESEHISAVQVGAVLDLMRQMVDVVVVDLGRHINETSVVVWERSDELIYVIDPSISAMRGAWRFLDLFGRLNIPGLEPKFVLNRWVARHPIDEKQIVHTLGRPLLCRIPRDHESIEHALARGEDLWKVAPRAALTRSYEGLCHQLSDTHHRHAKRGGILSKIFTRNGANPRS
jgi:pilus assembly protein CpaE